MFNMNETIEYTYVKRILWWCAMAITFIIFVIEIWTAFYDLCAAKYNVTISRMQSNSNVQPDSEPKPTTNNNARTLSTEKPKLSILLPILSYMFYCIVSINAVMLNAHYLGCLYGSISGAIFFETAKMFMYLVFIYRTYFVYSDSYFHYNTKVLIILSIIVILCTTFEIIMTGVTTNVKIMVGNNYACIPLTPYWLIIFVALFDLTISGICLFLFIRPLLLLSKQQNNEEIKIEMKRIVLKYTTLSIVAMLSTFIILIVIAIFDMTGFIAVDICCNCLCIMFFNRRYDRSFKTLCCGAIYVMSMIMDGKQNIVNNNENIVTNSNNQQN